LGIGNVTNMESPIEIVGNFSVSEIATGSFHSFIITTDGTAYGFGRNNFGQLGDGTYNDKWVASPSMENRFVMKMSLGQDFSIMLKLNGSIFSFGDNVSFFKLIT
jgi:alpha-tubulin suppressor-like RCC1 family protein